MKFRSKAVNVAIAILLIVSMVFGVGNATVLAADSMAKPEKVKVLIGFNDMPGRAEEALVRSFGGTVNYTYSLIPSIAAELPEQAVEALSRNPKIKIIEPDVKAYEIGSFETELNSTWGMVRIGEGAAHNQNYFGNGIKVAVIDTGIDYTHTELASVYRGGYDFVNHDNDPMDIDGHGTHVSGTVAAARNGSEVTGAAPGVELYSLKVLEGGSGDFSAIIAALEWCVVNGIQVTNNSYGASRDPGVQVHQAYDNAYANGVLHIGSAGNTGNIAGKGDNVGYPAQYSSVVAVAASDINDARASFSSTGKAVELIAPGDNILSTYFNNSYAAASGTSMASPHVAGVAAQVWAANPTLSNVQIRSILNNTAEDLGLPTTNQGSGLVRVDLAVAAAVNSTVPPDNTANMSLNVTTDQLEYVTNTIVNITAMLSNQTNSVANTNINITITNPEGKVTSLSGVTDSYGNAYVTYRLQKRSVKGIYQVNASLVNTNTEISATTSFQVN